MFFFGLRFIASVNYIVPDRNSLIELLDFRKFNSQSGKVKLINLCQIVPNHISKVTIHSFVNIRMFGIQLA